MQLTSQVATDYTDGGSSYQVKQKEPYVTRRISLAPGYPRADGKK